MNNKNKSGVTLIELIVVIVIMGVLSVSIAIKFSSPKEFNIQGASYLVREDIRYAIDYAINTGIHVKIQFDMNSPTGYTFLLKGTSGLWDEILKRPAEGTPYQVVLGQGDYQQIYLSEVNFNGSDCFYIDSMGIPLDSNLVPLNDRNSSYIKLNNQKKIIVEPVSGMVKIEDL